ncbi:MAG: muconolactone Delta-isomerase family protein [Acidimicrobiales bacterium]
MRFLVVTKSREPMPPEMALPMMKMMQAWVGEHRNSGKMKEVWSFAGIAGGGGIMDVDTHEELDSIMAGFPFAQHSEIQVYALADLDTALADNVERIEDIQKMMAAAAH